eukprot:CAMPEP_0168466718 /NCGR_PEP_ID=MMETSP0228-20121227/56807_1 /TAXON_ID=133427 /ORGANISM="Protoceratium reticulatum, Strain CCCM 535 (=CCMP 1889)" /LENGTH=64 /DNA_ID=CAMNT_0008482397 /DNA_START=600 /DNA_END=790 /DNA_ORIENTATION=+
MPNCENNDFMWTRLVNSESPAETSSALAGAPQWHDGCPPTGAIGLSARACRAATETSMCCPVRP